MGEASQWGVIIQSADHLGMRLVSNIKDDDATIDIGRIGTVGPLRIDVDVVRTEAGIELLMPHRRGHVVALPGARQPPASYFLRLAGVTDVDDGVELVILGVCGGKIGRTAADVHVFAIHAHEWAPCEAAGAIEEEMERGLAGSLTSRVRRLPVAAQSSGSDTLRPVCPPRDRGNSTAPERVAAWSESRGAVCLDR